MEFSRRFFIGSCLAAGASAGCSSFKGALSSKPIAKIGVLSDVHLKDPGDELHFVKALEYFRDNGADGVLVAGDIADTGRISQLKRAGDSWFKVFPDGKAPDGRKVEQLFVYGNHDRWGWTWGLNEEQKKDPAVIADSIGHSYENMKKAWEECFREEYVPVWMKNVNGIAVIGAHWGYRDDHNRAMEKFFEENGKRLDPHLPFFYTQHDHPKDTCFGAWAWGHDDGTSTRVLSAFPNAVAFSGHSHYTLTDERTVWQGAFTSINTSSLKYSSHDYSCRENAAQSNSSGYGGENRAHAMGCIGTGDGRQGMLVSVFDDRLEIERREFVYGESLGDNWIIPIPARADGPMAYARRAAKRRLLRALHVELYEKPTAVRRAELSVFGQHIDGDAAHFDLLRPSVLRRRRACPARRGVENVDPRRLADRGVDRRQARLASGKLRELSIRPSVRLDANELPDFGKR